MPPSRVRATTALTLLLAATTACTAAEHAPRPAPHTPPAYRQAEQFRLPLDAYASTVAETHLVEDAQDILIRRCMNGLGMEWKTLPRVDPRDTGPPNLRRYGADESTAVRHGYHPRPDPPWQTAEPTAAERATARKDVACQKSAELVTVWATAETRTQRRLNQQNSDRLHKEKTRKDRWLTAARRLLNRDAD